ncbi:hypothetical protein GQ42DRAFT_16647 [Ramicandelaber brevisporus]|nr:hypothetical protein GQ42DRAFT_16647 [Ramicandelaber brevisporus]
MKNSLLTTVRTCIPLCSLALLHTNALLFTHCTTPLFSAFVTLRCHPNTRSIPLGTCVTSSPVVLVSIYYLPTYSHTLSLHYKSFCLLFFLFFGGFSLRPSSSPLPLFWVYSTLLSFLPLPSRLFARCLFSCLLLSVLVGDRLGRCRPAALCHSIVLFFYFEFEKYSAHLTKSVLVCHVLSQLR